MTLLPNPQGRYTIREVVYRNNVQIHRVLSLPAAAAPVLEVEGGRDDDGDEERDREDEDGDTEDDEVGTI